MTHPHQVIQQINQAMADDDLEKAEKALEDYACKFCLHIVGELKFPSDKRSYDEKSNESFLMMLPSTINNRYRNFTNPII